jgi:general secretion pathway protein G
MAIETCGNCKRIIGELEQAYTWQNHILCKECYARLSNSTVTQPAPIDFHVPVILPPPQRSLVKSTLIVMATVIVAIVVISIVLSAPSIIPSILYSGSEARVITTKANLKMLHHAVAQFKMDTGRYPTKEEGLTVLINVPTNVTGYQPGGYIDSTTVPKDAWGYEFIYIAYPESGKPYAIVSYGADGKEGGEEYDADLYSTDAE